MSLISTSRWGEIQIVSGSILFGTATIFIKICLNHYSINPFVLNGLRSLFSASIIILSSAKLKQITTDKDPTEKYEYNIMKYCYGCDYFFRWNSMTQQQQDNIEKYVWYVLVGFSGWLGTTSFIISLITLGTSKAAFLLSLYVIT